MADTNVLGGPLVSCSTDPMTGWRRDGCCGHDPADVGRHLVCAVMTDEFLEFTRSRGNDLSTPNPAFGFPGLEPGDRWCLCVDRWREALEAGIAPPVVLGATSSAALDVVSLDELEAHSVDPAS